MATLYGVSVGPGDYELLTLKAVRIINEADIIAVPKTMGENNMALDIVKKAVDLSEKDIIYIDFPMSKGNTKVFDDNYDKIAGDLEIYLKNDKNIAFLNIGDVSIFSSFSYVGERVKKNNYDVQMIPGVSSIQGTAAKLGIPLVQRDESVLVVSGESQNFDELLSLNTNKVIMKGSKKIKDIKKICEGSEIYAVENLGLASEKVYDSKEALNDGAGYFTTIICK